MQKKPALTHVNIFHFQYTTHAHTYNLREHQKVSKFAYSLAMLRLHMTDGWHIIAAHVGVSRITGFLVAGGRWKL